MVILRRESIERVSLLPQSEIIKVAVCSPIRRSSVNQRFSTFANCLLFHRFIYAKSVFHIYKCVRWTRWENNIYVLIYLQSQRDVMLSNAGLSQFSFYLSERNVSLSPREDKKRRKWGQPNASPINRRVDTSSLYPCGESVVIIRKKKWRRLQMEISSSVRPMNLNRPDLHAISRLKELYLLVTLETSELRNTVAYNIWYHSNRERLTEAAG